VLARYGVIRRVITFNQQMIDTASGELEQVLNLPRRWSCLSLDDRALCS
jgi:hypothetical protein